MPSPFRPTPAQLVHRARLIQRIRAAHAEGLPFVPLAFMIQLAGGPSFEERGAQITAITERAMQSRKLTQRDAEALVRMERAVLAELAFDPRTEEDPLQPLPQTVPASRSVRAALLAGDSDAFLQIVLDGGLIPPAKGR